MMILPDNLSPRVYPLAWLLGSWKGWGMMPAREATAVDTPILVEMRVWDEGDVVHHSLRVRSARSRSRIDVTADALAGASALEAEGELWTETGTWTLSRSDAATASTETFGEGIVAIDGGRFGGQTTWAMRASGPRLSMRTAEITGALEGDQRIVEALRMYGLVGGELMMAEDAARNGEEACSSMTGRFARSDS